MIKKQINKENWTNLMCRKIPNKCMQILWPQGSTEYSPFLKCKLYIVTSFQRLKYGRLEKKPD